MEAPQTPHHVPQRYTYSVSVGLYACGCSEVTVFDWTRERPATHPPYKRRYAHGAQDVAGLLDAAYCLLQEHLDARRHAQRSEGHGDGREEQGEPLPGL